MAQQDDDNEDFVEPYQADIDSLQAEEQRNLITMQMQEVETINAEIMASLNYARRIQRAAVSPLKDIRDNFKESFVFYRPRDIVSGDFYRTHRCGRYAVMVTDDSLPRRPAERILADIHRRAQYATCRRTSYNLVVASAKLTANAHNQIQESYYRRFVSPDYNDVHNYLRFQTDGRTVMTGNQELDYQPADVYRLAYTMTQKRFITTFLASHLNTHNMAYDVEGLYNGIPVITWLIEKQLTGKSVYGMLSLQKTFGDHLTLAAQWHDIFCKDLSTGNFRLLYYF